MIKPSKMKNRGLIEFDRSVCLKNCVIILKGNGTSVKIGKNCILNDVHILVDGENAKVVIGDNVHVNASKHQPTHINACGENCSVTIGEGSLISNNLEIHTTDYHKIYDMSGKRINEDKSVSIGKRVWLGLVVAVLKGAAIPDGTIVGARAFVSGKIKQSNAVFVGSPAKIIKTDCSWREI